MTLPTHRMSADMFEAIARARAGVPAVAALRSGQDSKTKVLLREIVDSAAGPRAAYVERAYDLLARLSESHPVAFRKVLRHPVVAAWAVQAAGPNSSEDLPARMAYVAAAAAIRSGTRHELDLPVPDSPEPIVPLPTLGHVTVPEPGGRGPLRLRTGPDLAELTCGPAVVRIGGSDPRWSPTPRVDAEAGGLGIELLLDRTSWLLAPGLTGNGRHQVAGDGPDLVHWSGHIGQAWRVLTSRHRAVAEEAAATYTALTPLASPRRGNNSGTYEDAFGCLAMSPPVSPVTGAAGIAHELRHAELAALMDLFPLVEPDDDNRYYAPWRSDPRPVRGLLHGVYAHLGLASFWAVEVRRGGPAPAAEIQLARWRRGAHEGAHTLLDQARLTPLGRRFVTFALDELHHLTRVPVARAARELADREADEHRREWVRANS